MLALLPSANLRQARIQSATGSLLIMFESWQVQREKSETDVKGHGSADTLTGEYSIAVRDLESTLHGEEKQFECVCDVN